MKRSHYQLYRNFTRFGIDPLATFFSLKGLRFYWNDFKELKKQKAQNTDFAFGMKIPILGDKFSEASTMKGHYFHQDLHVAKRIFKQNPEKHLDIGSRGDGFVAHIAVFRPIDVMDIRTLKSSVQNIVFRQADLMQLPSDLLNAYDSISSLHAIEHFGLGRYNDPVDYFGHLKAIANITKILKSQCNFYFSVPIGPQRIEFNAHRVFSIPYLLNIFQKEYQLVQFSYVNDAGDFFENVELTDENSLQNLGCTFGCGIFEWKKIS